MQGRSLVSLRGRGGMHSLKHRVQAGRLKRDYRVKLSKYMRYLSRVNSDLLNGIHFHDPTRCAGHVPSFFCSARAANVPRFSLPWGLPDPLACLFSYLIRCRCAIGLEMTRARGSHHHHHDTMRNLPYRPPAKSRNQGRAVRPTRQGLGVDRTTYVMNY
jgi:hypothetical protein